MNQIARCDWLPERARWSHLARSGLPAVSLKQNFTKSHIINPLLTKFVRSRWLDIGLVLFLRVYGPRLRLRVYTDRTQWGLYLRPRSRSDSPGQDQILLYRPPAWLIRAKYDPCTSGSFHLGSRIYKLRLSSPEYSPAYMKAADAGVIKAILNFYHVNSDPAFERHRGRIPINDLNIAHALKKHLIQFLGLKELTIKYGLGDFDI